MGAVGSPLFRFMAHCRGLPPAPITRAPSPQGGQAPKNFGGGRPPPRGCRHTALKIIACAKSPYKIITASRCRHCSWVLLGRGRLSLPAVALPLSPSLASPPPSLRSGTSPQGDFMCLSRVCVPPFRHRLWRSLHIGTHEKRLGPFLCGVGCALRCALSEHRIERNGVPRPISIFYPITASL